MMLLTVPMYLLYEISIAIVWLIGRAQARRDAAEEAAAAPPAP
jgi:Sec-independent protein secretion pathway component TatC